MDPYSWWNTPAFYKERQQLHLFCCIRDELKLDRRPCPSKALPHTWFSTFWEAARLLCCRVWSSAEWRSERKDHSCKKDCFSVSMPSYYAHVPLMYMYDLKTWKECALIKKYALTCNSHVRLLTRLYGTPCVLHVRMYVCTYVRMYECMYVYVCMCVCMYECIYVCMYVCMYVCVCVVDVCTRLVHHVLCSLHIPYTCICTLF